MILKDLDPFSSADKFLVAGRRAEEQMSHYLRRFFASSGDVDVLNSVRVKWDAEVAQMDHLVLHPFGLTIVESKSVAGSVQIKEDGQWIRWFNKQPQGMRSPITQAKMQGMVLRELLASTVKQKGFFDQVEIDLLVAISDSGTIQWPSTGALHEVCKADQVPDRILGHIERCGTAGRKPLLSSEHRQAIGAFLSRVHRPFVPGLERPKEAAPSPMSEAETASPARELAAAVATREVSEKACKHCGGRDLQVHYGKFGYYFVCDACQKNTAIKFACAKCGGDGRLRKQGNDFFAECRSCAASSLYHSNRPAA